jgi:hypothetical protein
MRISRYLIGAGVAALGIGFGVYIRADAPRAPGGTSLPTVAATAAAARTVHGGAVAGAERRKTGPHTVENAETGATISLGGEASYAVQFTAGSDYDPTFSVVLVNADAGRAKRVVMPGGGFMLWPQQSALVFRQGDGWRTLRPERWKLAAAPLTVYTDFDRGDDANDGLAPGPGGAMRTVQGALGRVLDEFDFHGTAATKPLTIRMADETNDTAGVHFSAHGFVGAQGGAAVVVQGGAHSTLSKVGGSAFQVYFGTVIQLRNVRLESDQSCLDASHGATVYFGDVTFGPGGVAHVQAFSGARVEAMGPWTVDGDARYGVVVGDGATFQSAFAPSFARDVKFDAFVLAARSGSASFTAPTIPLGGRTVHGQRYLAVQNGTIFTGNTDPNFLPGDRAGSTSSGGIYD